MSKKLEDKLERAKVKQLESALRQERTGLQAIATAFLEESSDPDALLRRLESMANNAVRTGKPQRLRDVLVYGLDIYRRALDRHELRPQPLWEDKVSCEQDVSVLELARPRVQSGSVLNPSEEHRAASEDEQGIRTKILALYQFEGALSDYKLHEKYVERHGPITNKRLWTQRKVLTSVGAVTNRGGTDDGESYRWDLTERHEKFAAEEREESVGN